MELFARLVEQGQTIILVTHETDIACHARRIVENPDGQIISDLPVQKDTAWEQVHGSAGQEGEGL